MKKILISALTALLCVSLSAQNAPVLKLNLEKNKVYRMRSVTEQTVAQTVNGIQQNVVTDVTYAMSLKMLDKTNDFIVTEIHFDTIITNTNSMGKATIINSTLEGDMKSTEIGDIMSCIMNRISRNALYVKLDYSGKPLEVVNQKMLSDMVLKDTSSITLTGPTADAIKKQLASSISSESLMRMIDQFTWTLPAKQVATGEKWQMNQLTTSGGMSLEIKTTCKLDDIQGETALISSESAINPAPGARPIQSPGATVTYDNLKGMSKSAILTDISTGLTIKNEAKTHISGNLGVSGPGFSMDIPMDINGESKVYLVK